MKESENLARLKLIVVTRFGARVFSRQELLDAWREEYPAKPTSSILPADYCVNRKLGGIHQKGVARNNMPSSLRLRMANTGFTTHLGMGNGKWMGRV